MPTKCRRCRITTLQSETDVRKTSIDAVKARVESESESRKNSDEAIKTSLQSESESRKSAINVVKTSLERKTSAVTSRVADLETDQKYAIQTYFSKHKIRFMGMGYYGNYQDRIDKSGCGLKECGDWCITKRREEGSAWNGFFYRTYDKDCGCLKGLTGFTGHPQHILYQFE